MSDEDEVRVKVLPEESISQIQRLKELIYEKCDVLLVIVHCNN